MPETITGPMPPEETAFRRALRPLVGQVSVLTVLPKAEPHIGALAGAPQGMTLTSAYALSTQPAMLIACINTSASLHSALGQGVVIGWQVLGAAMQGVAERFAGKDGARGAARFDGAEWRDEDHPAGPARLLVGATLACAAQIEAMHPHATHSVVIARILSQHSMPQAGALAYRDGAYLPL